MPETKPFTAIEIETTFSRSRKNQDTYLKIIGQDMFLINAITFEKVANYEIDSIVFQRNDTPMPPREEDKGKTDLKEMYSWSPITVKATDVGKHKRRAVEVETEFRAVKAESELKKFKASLKDEA